MSSFKKIQEDIQAFLNGVEEAPCLNLSEAVQAFEEFGVSESDTLEFSVKDLLESEAFQESEVLSELLGAVIGTTAAAVGLKALAKQYEAKKLGCDKLSGDKKSNCMFKAHLEALNKKKALYVKAKNSCSTESCKKSADKTIKNVDGQIKELLKKAR
jgi:hypothetical protein